MNRVDEKGKIFTERIRKAGVEVEIETIREIVHGIVHVRSHERVKDLLNATGESFLAVTEADVRRVRDDQAKHVGFIAINKLHIVTVVPINEPQPQFEEDH